MKRIALLGTALATICVAAPASALDLYGIDLKVGVRGGPNISLLAQPAGAEAFRNIPYADYIGVGWNAGVALNFRIFNIGAIEVGWTRSMESAAGTIELKDVSDCRVSALSCKRQEVEQEFSFTADHIPVVAQISLPFGVARPFVSVGADFVGNRTSREYAVNGRSQLPSELDANDPADADLLADWASSARAQGVLRGDLNPAAADSYVGIIAGVGVDIVLERIEIPVEFRANIYPQSGSTLPERGVFADACTDPDCAWVEGTAPPLYNDNWTAQFFVLFGIDYRIF